MREAEQTISVIVGTDHVVVKRSGQSRVIVAGILGREHDEGGAVKTLWLDRLIHRSTESRFVDVNATWEVSGAMSSILVRAIKEK
jgi:hypothetical protein